MLPAWKLKPPTSVAEMAAEFSTDPSVLTLSAMMTSPSMPLSRRERDAFSMRVASGSALLRQGITIESYGFRCCSSATGHYSNPEPRLKTESSPRSYAGRGALRARLASGCGGLPASARDTS